jgi:phosphohistidine swiveling domain-containing protein
MNRWITDWEPSERFPVYTRANSGEIVPKPISPIGWDLVWGGGVSHGWADGCHRFGTFGPEESNPERPDYIACFGGYVYLNASMIRIVGVRSPGMSADMMDAAFLGNHPDVPEYVPQAGDEAPEREPAIEATMGAFMTATEMPAELNDDRAMIIAVRDERPDLPAASDAELVARARAMTPVVRDLFERYYVYGTASAVGPGILGELCGAIDPSLPGRLISGLGNIDSAPPAHAIWAMSRMEPDSPELDAALADFQREHGARGPGEWDAANPSWEVDAAPVLVAVNAMRRAGDDLSPAARHERAIADREAAEAEARAVFAGNDEALAALDLGLRVASIFVPARERTKLSQMMAVHEVRLPMYELGRRMMGRGIIAEARDVFLLLDAELDDFLADPGSFTDLLATRKAEFAELAELQDPFIINGVVPPLAEWKRREEPSDPVSVGEVLQGAAGSPGTVTGRARVILDPGDARGLEEGEILVAPVTDPSWTPLFIPAAGVVVDVGAPLSHAVIVSRELGVPCACSVTGAAHRIPDGALISLDGSTGAVTIIELPA